jgi:SAM-dependent methyltransferase
MLHLLRLPTLSETKELDSNETALVHKTIILSKPLLKFFYTQQYSCFKSVADSAPQGPMLELGSGSGFLKETFSDAITSDMRPLSNVDMIYSATEMPFQTGSIATIVMLDVLHHIPDCSSFFAEASRVLMDGGKLMMIEPANTLWGRFIYRNFHHEPFEPEQKNWELEGDSPMETANGALPWIIFQRDRDRFLDEFPDLRIESIRYKHPLLYLLSGGLTLRQLLPAFTLPLILALEKLTTPLMPFLGMFMEITLVKIHSTIHQESV